MQTETPEFSALCRKYPHCLTELKQHLILYSALGVLALPATILTEKKEFTLPGSLESKISCLEKSWVWMERLGNIDFSAFRYKSLICYFEHK